MHSAALGTSEQRYPCLLFLHRVCLLGVLEPWWFLYFFPLGSSQSYFCQHFISFILRLFHLLLPEGFLDLIFELSEYVLSSWYSDGKTFSFFVCFTYRIFCHLFWCFLISSLISFYVLLAVCSVISLNSLNILNNSFPKDLLEWLSSWLLLSGSSRDTIFTHKAWWGSELLSHCGFCSLEMFLVCCFVAEWLELGCLCILTVRYVVMNKCTAMKYSSWALSELPDQGSKAVFLSNKEDFKTLSPSVAHWSLDWILANIEISKPW